MNWKTKLVCTALCAAQLLCAIPSVCAAEAAAITPDMTMQQIRNDPVMQQSGLFLYGSFGEGTQWTRSRLEDQTLQEYAWGQAAEETAAALNLAAQNTEDGVQMTWQVYRPEEIAADPSLGCVQLFYFPGKEPGGKYAVVMGGNALTINGTFGEGLPTAWELHEKGYTVFVLRYRAWTDLGDNAPLQDLGNAVNFISAHAEQLRVQPEDYAVVAYSSGAQVAGVFANRKRGYGAFGAQKPGALLLGYPIVDFSILKPVYHTLYDPTSCGWRYYLENWIMPWTTIIRRYISGEAITIRSLDRTKALMMPLSRPCRCTM